MYCSDEHRRMGRKQSMRWSPLESGSQRHGNAGRGGSGGIEGTTTLTRGARKLPATPGLAQTFLDELGRVPALSWPCLHHEVTHTAWAKPRLLLARTAQGGREAGAARWGEGPASLPPRSKCR